MPQREHGDALRSEYAEAALKKRPFNRGIFSYRPRVYSHGSRSIFRTA